MILPSSQSNVLKIRKILPTKQIFGIVNGVLIIISMITIATYQ